MFVESKIKWGEIIIKVDDKGKLCGLWFKGQKYFPKIDEEILTEDQLGNSICHLGARKVIDQMKDFETGKINRFELQLNPQGTDFQRLVWQYLSDIPMGETTTYGEISKKVAKALGKETMSAQAVGGAVGHNPISIIVPCHRVLGAKGQLTGYASGLDKKIALLKHEGIMID